jgi:hypothetical protein
VNALEKNAFGLHFYSENGSRSSSRSAQCLYLSGDLTASRSKCGDLLVPSVHYCGMARSVRVRAPCFAVAVQFACGLETVELRDSSEGGESAPTVATQQQQMGEDQPAVQPEAANSEVPEVPSLGGLEGAGDLDFGAAGAAGCTKVDFLFVIDNSPSMAFAQENLRNRFAGFLSVLGDNLQANDFNIMVVDTDGPAEGDEAEEAGSTDGQVPVDACGDTLGAGRPANAQTGEDCSLTGGRRYATRDQPDLESTFACMATVGTRGSAREQTVDALLAAVSAENGPNGCNEGFLRRDAILVTTIITNTDDDDSLDEPQVWYERLLALKDGNEASVVLLGFLPGDPFNASSSGLLCNVFAAINRAPRLEDFVARFTHHRVASVCEADYGPYLALAVENIDLACNDFVAPVIQ